MSEVAQGEALVGGDAQRRRKALSHIATLSYAETGQERAVLGQIAGVLFPDGVSGRNEANDVEIAFNAKKYGAILITADGGSRRQPGGILGNRGELARLGVQVMTDEEAVAHVEELIARRDRIARELASATATPVPEWVGLD